MAHFRYISGYILALKTEFRSWGARNFLHNMLRWNILVQPLDTKFKLHYT